MKHRIGLSLVLLLSFVAVAHAATPGVDRAQVPTGILYDLTAQIAHIERLDGEPAAPPANSSVLRQAVFELRNGSLEAGAVWPSDERLRDSGSLVVRIGFDERAPLLAADPSIYYLTDHYVDYPVVLVRLSRIHTDGLRDLVKMGWQFVSAWAPKRRTRKRGRSSRT